MKYDAKRGFWENHTPGAKLDYAIDYSNYLETGDVIQSSTWLADAGITLSGETLVDKVSTVFAQGGEVGTHYKITNTITTANGLIDIHSILLVCE